MQLLDKIGLFALYALPPETAHHAALYALEHHLVAGRDEPDDPVLRTRIWDLNFPNPVGLAAGFDKDARVSGAMLSLGFGFVEAGTVTPRPQPGNPKPRLFRLDEDHAVINRLGFNSGGVDAFARRLAAHRDRPGRRGIVGANVGKNRDTMDAADDYVTSIGKVAEIADYIVINISSPNTPGLRDLQARAALDDLLRRSIAARNRAVQGARKPPLLAKVGPDLTPAQMAAIAEVALATGVDGLIVGNTTVARPPELSSRDRAEAGGLSGAPLFKPSTECLAEIYRLTKGRIPLIGCGGIADGATAYAKIRAGASLVQLYSALIFHGPGLVRRIKQELTQLLRKDGWNSVAEAVGCDCREMAG
ncbi:MAG TPA: quinone-dependent dihydroorotate dehydrogenase [Micropepsaceae bacterium]|nr:quinone-dependent dihydroorotate dehydrogenase [Micropepsaceae bacterium]